MTVRMRLKRLAVVLKKTWKFFVVQFKELAFQDEVDRSFKKKYPEVNIDRISNVESIRLTYPEQIYLLEKELHALKCEVEDQFGHQRGKMSKEQIFWFCLYRREIDLIKKKIKDESDI